MTYEEFLRNSLEEKNKEGMDLAALEADGWTVENVLSSLSIKDSAFRMTKSKGSASVTTKFVLSGSRQLFINFVSIIADGVDVTNEEIGTIDAVDALLGTGLDAASKKAEELKKRKLVTVANLQKALEDYDERKGTAVEDGEPVDEKNKVFIDGSGRVYARNIQLARQSGLDDEKSERQSADNRLSAEIAKKADKEHTHKAADITDMPNYARSVNGEEPDADGNVEIDIDAVEEVAELPGETKKKVYLVPEVEEQSVSVDCSSVESIMSAIADWLSGEGGHSFSTPDEFLEFMKGLETDKGEKKVLDRDYLQINFFGNKEVVVNGETAPSLTLVKFDYVGSSYYVADENSNTVITSYLSNKKQGLILWSFGLRNRLSFYWGYGLANDGSEVNTGWRTMTAKGFSYIMSSTVTLPSSISLIDRRTPPAVYAKSVELATKEALSEATSGADEKAAALGERIGAVESSVTTAKADIATMKSDISTAKTNITAMKSNITEAQANITTAQSDIATAKSDITKAQGDIESVTSEVETVKNDVAALETKVVRSVNGTEPDENGNVEVAASSGASDKNDTITVSDTDSAVSDDTGILSGESKENPKGLLRFAASKLWDYIRGKIDTVMGIRTSASKFLTVDGDVTFKGTIDTPTFNIDSDGWIYSSVVRREMKSFTSSGGGDNEIRVVFNTPLDTSSYCLFFEITRGAEFVVHPIQVNNKDVEGFDVTVYTDTEDEIVEFEYTAIILKEL